MVFITTTSRAGDSGHSIASSESSTACPDVLPGHPPRGVTRQKYCEILHDSQVSRLASFLRASRTSLNARTRDLPNLHGISDLARDVLAREGLPAIVKRFSLSFSCINVERESLRSIVNPGQCHDFSSSAKLIKNGIASLPFPLPALLKQYWYIKRGERVVALSRLRRFVPASMFDRSHRKQLYLD